MTIGRAMNGPAPLCQVWRSRAVRLALAAVPLWFTIAVLVFNTPRSTKLLVGTVFAGTIASPSAGLLAVAALCPLAHLIQTGLQLEPFRIGEAIAVAFLAGWLVRGGEDRPGPQAPATVGSMLAVVVAASVIAQAWRLSSTPGELPDTFRIFFQAYYLLADRIGFDAGARIIEGLALLGATTVLFRTNPRLAVTLPAVMTAAAVLAAISSWLVTHGIAPAAVLAEHARFAPRISAHVGDVNAAASYFGMMLLVALGMAARHPSPQSVIWLAAAIAEAAALWATGSRTGVASAAIVFGVAAACAATAHQRRAVRRTTLAVAVIAALAAAGVRARMLHGDPGTSFREQFTATSLRMIAERPVLGVGVGQYYDVSPLFLTPEMAWVYGAQNAHNYFLQVSGELGVIGLAFFIVLLGLITTRGVRAIMERPDDMRLLGCLAGVVMLLATCLTGHPLLLDEVASSFWILAGLVTALSGSVLLNTAAGICRPTFVSPPAPPVLSRGCLVEAVRRAAVGGVALIALASAGAVERPLGPPVTAAVDGMEPWEAGADGTRYRWTRDYASVFVPSDVTRVHIPLRLPVDLPQIAPMAVAVSAGGVAYGTTAVGSTWAVLDVELPPISPVLPYRRVNLKVAHTWRQAIYVPGSSDLRKVGVQVGQVSWVK